MCLIPPQHDRAFVKLLRVLLCVHYPVIWAETQTPDLKLPP